MACPRYQQQPRNRAADDGEPALEAARIWPISISTDLTAAVVRSSYSAADCGSWGVIWAMRAFWRKCSAASAPRSPAMDRFR